MINHCKDCKKEMLFDDTFDEECFRCCECGCLPYYNEMTIIVQGIKK